MGIVKKLTQGSFLISTCLQGDSLVSLFLKLENIKESYNVLKFDVFEANQIKEIWSTFSEVEVYFDSVDKAVGFCIDYLPSSVEILEPPNVNIESFKFADVLNDLIGKLHMYETVIRNLRASNIRLKK